MENKEILEIIDDEIEEYNKAIEAFNWFKNSHPENSQLSNQSAKASWVIYGLQKLKERFTSEQLATSEDNTHDYVIRANRLERKFDPAAQDYTWVTVESKTISILTNVSATKAMDIYSEYTRAYGETNWQYSLERLDQ